MVRKEDSAFPRAAFKALPPFPSPVPQLGGKLEEGRDAPGGWAVKEERNSSA